MNSYPTPEHVVRTEHLRGGFTKIYLEETGRPFHHLTEADPIGQAHSHPFGMTSHVVLGSYEEEVFTLLPGGGWESAIYTRKAGTSHRIEAATIHRIASLPTGSCLTHVEPGPPEQEWSHYDFRPDGSVWHRLWNEEEWKPL